MTTYALFLFVMSSIGAHWIYNKEDIFSGFRNRKLPKVFWCAACNAFWIILGCFLLTAFWEHNKTLAIAEFVGIFLHVLAAYIIVRAVYGANDWFEKTIFYRQDASRSFANGVVSTPPAIYRAGDALVTPAPACSTCGANKAQLQEHNKAVGYSSRAVILTSFHDFQSSYSLTSCVIDQALALAMDPKKLVQILVAKGCRREHAPSWLPPNVEIVDVVPHLGLKVDVIDSHASALTASALRQHLITLSSADVIVHDWLFVSQYVTLSKAIHSLSSLPGFRWWHVCHSAPGKRPEGIEKDENKKWRYSLPMMHRLICLSKTQVKKLAEYYNVSENVIDVVSNVRDVRTITKCSSRLYQFIHDNGIDEADVVQIFPASAPRLISKGAKVIIASFAKIKTKAKLVFALAHANDDTARKIINELKTFAATLGIPEKTIVFTSEDMPETAQYGLSAQDIDVLMRYCNLFIMPSRSEASSLTLREAALANAYIVINGNVPSLADDTTFDETVHFDVDYPEKGTEKAADWARRAIGKKPKNKGIRSLAESLFSVLLR